MHRFWLTGKSRDFNLEMYREALANLSPEELIALVLAEAAQIEELTRRIAELEAKLGQPPKTPDNLSLPPSRGAKPNQPSVVGSRGARGHAGRFRRLRPQPGPDIRSVGQSLCWPKLAESRLGRSRADRVDARDDNS